MTTVFTTKPQFSPPPVLPHPRREQGATKPPETERLMMILLTLGPDGGGEEVKPLLMLTFHILDKIKRLRLSKEVN